MNAYKQEVYGKLIKVLANVLVICAVTVSMYVCAQHPDESAKVFSMWFFPQLCAIIALTLVALRVVRRIYPSEQAQEMLDASVVDLPRVGRKLVQWRVLEY